jgi:hypothetical protein
MPSRDLMSRIEVWAKTWVPAFVVEERSRYSQPMPHPNGKGTSTIVSAMNAGQFGWSAVAFPVGCRFEECRICLAPVRPTPQG